MSQSSDVFRHLEDKECQELMTRMRTEARPLYKQLESVAAATLRLRPVFLGKQPFPKRCQMIRKAMSLKVNSEEAGELLAAFFMNAFQDEVGELLDALGVEHEEGALTDAAPEQPAAAKLKKAVAEFCKGDDAVLRGVLVKTFAAQSAIDWPALDEMMFPVLEKTGGKK